MRERLERAKRQKQEEADTLVAYRKSQWGDKEWLDKQITRLRIHVKQIDRHLVDGPDLELPLCSKDRQQVCLMALQPGGSDGCIFSPDRCPFLVKVIPGEQPEEIRAAIEQGDLF